MREILLMQPKRSCLQFAWNSNCIFPGGTFQLCLIFTRCVHSRVMDDECWRRRWRRRFCWYRGCRVVVLLAKCNYLFAACLSCFTRIILILVFCQNFTMPMVLVLVGVGYNAYPDDADDIFFCIPLNCFCTRMQRLWVMAWSVCPSGYEASKKITLQRLINSWRPRFWFFLLFPPSWN